MLNIETNSARFRNGMASCTARAPSGLPFQATRMRFAQGGKLSGIGHYEYRAAEIHHQLNRQPTPARRILAFRIDQAGDCQIRVAHANRYDLVRQADFQAPFGGRVNFLCALFCGLQRGVRDGPQFVLMVMLDFGDHAGRGGAKYPKTGRKRMNTMQRCQMGLLLGCQLQGETKRRTTTC